MRQAAGTRNSTSRASQQSIPSARDAFAEEDYLKMNSLASCSSQETENPRYHTLLYVELVFPPQGACQLFKTGRKDVGEH